MKKMRKQNLIVNFYSHKSEGAGYPEGKKRLRSGVKKASIRFLIALILLNFVHVSFGLSSSNNKGTFELLIGHYYLSESRFKAVYPGRGIIAGIGISVSVIQNFDFYIEAKGFHKQGELTYSKEKTQLFLFPVSLNIRYKVSIGPITPYIGGGIDVHFYFETNPIGNIADYTSGYNFQGGTYFHFGKNFPILLNLKIKYSKANKMVNNLKIELGGLEYGVGLAFVF